MTTEDLMGIGMGRPAARRLLDAVNKRRKGTLKKKIFQSFTTSSAVKDKYFEKPIIESNQESTGNLTCLIKESVSEFDTCY